MDLIPKGISVVIPTYNRAHLIKESLQSVLDQTLQPLEIIVVDDFSTDNTEEVVKSLNSPLIKFVKNQRKKGANGARNTGILMAKGEYIAFHDSDDTWLPEKLKKQFKVLNGNTNVSLCFCSFKTENNLIVPKKKIREKSINENLKLRNFISTQTIFVRRNLAMEVLFDEYLSRFQDWDFVLRFSEQYQIFHLNEVLVVQSLNNGSITKTVNYLESYKKIYEKHPDLYKLGIFNKVVCSELELKDKYSATGFMKLALLKILRKFFMLVVE